MLEAIQPEPRGIQADLDTDDPGTQAEKPSNVSVHAQFKRGDVEAGLTQADAIVERQFQTPMVQ